LKVLGTGYITRASVTAREAPNGKFFERLGLFQAVTIIEQVDDHGSTWYHCGWDTDQGAKQGWILAEYVTFGSPPSQ
jgi:hypothetical protein